MSENWPNPVQFHSNIRIQEMKTATINLPLPFYRIKFTHTQVHIQTDIDFDPSRDIDFDPSRDIDFDLSRSKQGTVTARQDKNRIFKRQ